ncbi:MAG: ribosomal protein RSM22 (predicted rRNA methylase) [Alteromonadaceae bacterium]
MKEHYGNMFYEDQVTGSLSSATEVLQVVFDIYRPKSLLDVGCGRGAWLLAAEKLGVDELHGIDGPWVKTTDLLSNKINFLSENLETKIPISQRYDMAMSVEVAEHLSESSAQSLVSSLCAAADIVIFGAAVKAQGGENHINEQRQSYWANHFMTNNYCCLDIIRPKVWLNGSVDIWYRQNTLVYINNSRTDLIELFSNAECGGMLDLIHPVMFENRERSRHLTLEKPSLRLILGLIRSYIYRVMRIN